MSELLKPSAFSSSTPEDPSQWAYSFRARRSSLVEPSPYNQYYAPAKLCTTRQVDLNTFKFALSRDREGCQLTFQPVDRPDMTLYLEVKPVTQYNNTLRLQFYNPSCKGLKLTFTLWQYVADGSLVRVAERTGAKLAGIAWSSETITYSLKQLGGPDKRIELALSVTTELDASLDCTTGEKPIAMTAPVSISANTIEDCVLVCEGQEFNCHRTVLAAASITFEEIFSKTWPHINGSYILVLNNIEAKTVKDMLSCIYGSAQWSRPEDMVTVGLFIAAYYYKLNEVENFCENFYRQKLAKKQHAQEILVISTITMAHKLYRHAATVCHTYGIPIPNCQAVMKVKKKFLPLQHKPDPKYIDWYINQYQ